MRYELGLIGGGNMAEAIVRAAIGSGALSPAAILIADPEPARRALFEAVGVATTTANAEVVAGAVQVMLAVKPQVLEKIAGDLAGFDRRNQIVLSIMAGVRSEKIERVLGGPARVVRVMPNTPLLAGAGMSAIALGPHARPGDELLATQLFAAAGEAMTVDESLMDAVTAVSGSGPAYVFYLAEAMTAAAESLGLTPEQASLLVRQTVYGAAKLLTESSDAPAELRRKVTSPGGTTQAACTHLDATQVAAHIADAIRRAADRSRELGA